MNVYRRGRGKSVVYQYAGITMTKKTLDTLKRIKEKEKLQQGDNIEFYLNDYHMPQEHIKECANKIVDLIKERLKKDVYPCFESYWELLHSDIKIEKEYAEQLKSLIENIDKMLKEIK